jgi:A/G-specific adenine glycosylase
MPDAFPPVKTDDAISHSLLRWYADHARPLPWRILPGAMRPADDPDWPYRVWLSEIMLQQTTVPAVTPYFAAFTTRWPSVAALATAKDADVMHAWAGLGYYARARNLLACARMVVSDHGGQFPGDETALRTLPGIGSYTAAAIAAFAFGKRAVVVDGNIERVIARLFAISTPLPAARAEITARMDALTPQGGAGDFAQGLMDLARAICTPRNPKCPICPIAEDCAGRGNPMAYPVKAKKAAKPDRIGFAYWIERGGKVWLVRRPDNGLLGGMRALPSDGWDRSDPPRIGEGDHLQDGGGGAVLGTVTHVFTHFRLTLSLVSLDAEKGCAIHPGGEWWPKAALENAGLPSLFAKAVAVATGKDD